MSCDMPHSYCIVQYYVPSESYRVKFMLLQVHTIFYSLKACSFTCPSWCSGGEEYNFTFLKILLYHNMLTTEFIHHHSI